MEILSRYGYLPKLSFSNFAFCEHCEYGKQIRNAHMTYIDSSTWSLDLVHTNTCGPMHTRSLGGRFYFTTFIDGANREDWVYL